MDETMSVAHRGWRPSIRQCARDVSDHRFSREIGKIATCRACFIGELLALPAEVGEVVEGATVASAPGVEEHALAQGVVGDHHLGEVELVHHLLEDQGPRQDDDEGPEGGLGQGLAPRVTRRA